MTRAKRPIVSLIIAFLAWVGVGGIIWKLPPSWPVETLVVCLLTLALVLTVAWAGGSTKRAIQIALFGVGLLVMKRLGLLGWITVGLWVMVWGLIGLIS